MPKDRVAAFAELEVELPKMAVALYSGDGWDKWIEVNECESEWPKGSSLRSNVSLLSRQYVPIFSIPQVCFGAVFVLYLFLLANVLAFLSPLRLHTHSHTYIHTSMAQ
jgi:hypothetical protein